MTIYKHPEFNICTCEKCGTVFKPDWSDTLEYRFEPPLGEKYEVYTRCPTCEYYCEVTVKKETKQFDYEKVATDFNVGGKKIKGE